LYCEINFDTDGDWFSKKKTTKDYFTGTIWKGTDKLMEKIKGSMDKNKEVKINLKDKEDIVNVVSKIEGNWLDHVSFDGNILWKFENFRPYQLTTSQSALPSDCTYRKDIILLKLEEEAKSQDLKNKAEDAQRRDGKLRAENEKKVLKAKAKTKKSHA